MNRIKKKIFICNFTKTISSAVLTAVAINIIMTNATKYALIEGLLPFTLAIVIVGLIDLYEYKIYEKQVLVEAINHFNLLVNKFYEISYYNDENYDNTMELQEYLINFERFFKTTYLSNFGEINHVLNYCYEELEWEELIKLSNELLEIKKNHQINRKNENLQYLVILIAILSFLYQYVDRLYINILIGIVILFYLIFKEKIHYLWQVLKSILKFFYYKIV